MAEAMDVDVDDSSDSDEFPDDDPKFNHYSFAFVKRCEKKLLDVQLEALVKLQKWFKKDDRKIAQVVMPTGSGKTGIICCTPYFLGTEGMEEVPGKFPKGTPRHCFDKPILVIAPNLNISDQLEDRMLTPSKDSNFFLRRRIVRDEKKKEKRGLPSGVKIEGTRELNGPKSAAKLGGKEVIIANAQKFLEGKWEEELPDELFKLVMVDEAHHFPATTWTRIITKFRGNALVAFFTATPYRGDGKYVVREPFAYHLKLEDAIKRRIIRKTEFYEETKFSLPKSILFLSELTPEERTKWKVYLAILEKVKEIQERKDKCSPLPKETKGQGSPVPVPHMAFAIAKEKSEANIVANLWNAHFEDAPAITYHSGDKDFQPERMEQILGNKVRLVVVVDMLQEGFDHPPISIAAIMTKITSPVKFVQFIGRAQRIARGPGGKESDTITADIVTHSYFQQKENYVKFASELFTINDLSWQP